MSAGTAGMDDLLPLNARRAHLSALLCARRDLSDDCAPRIHRLIVEGDVLMERMTAVRCALQEESARIERQGQYAQELCRTIARETARVDLKA